MKICFTSALFGDPKTLDKPAKFERNPNYDYFLFTDIDEEHFDTSWDVINIKDNPNISSLTSNVRKSRYPKFMSWELLETMGRHYDVVFYCDGHYAPNNHEDVEFEKLATKIKNEKEFPFVQTEHIRLSVRRGGINAEMQQIVISGWDDEKSMNKTKLFFKKYDPSVDLDYPQYFENTCFGYSFENENVRNITKRFWDIYTTEDITYRDQPLWNFLLLKYNFKPIIENKLRAKTMRRRWRHRCLFIRFKDNMGTMRENYK
tara:strand:+ start:58140 stop:58919 length:780 start_codon:yes stop_codon:yes gene_type:complete